ncbi:MAG: hypothetical protein COV44_10200 [Deltaproteobacteria bacterium CG11_big_fil_rev_8_21_14_0_20_45_16]|nr:MAG: hypothetical protein COV44_10200 [Deltaproteobacteria bacterium CG11_big_fil_rev_8_21_14_0_20_45_16]
MALGHFRLFILLMGLVNLLAAAPSKPIHDEQVYDAIGKGEWQSSLDLLGQLSPKQSKMSLGQRELLKRRALFELEKWDELRNLPEIQDKSLKAHDGYLRARAAFESKNYEQFLSVKWEQEFPRSFREILDLFKARSLTELNRIQEAKVAYRDFLKNHPYSSAKSDATLELADIEWRLENQFEALALYEKIYINHPARDTDNIAKKRLQETGRLDSLDADAHLSRIQRLKRAALFSKAIRELASLEKKISPQEAQKVEIAIARLEFAQKNYSRAESLSKKSLREKEIDPDYEIQWLQLLAFSLTRQGKYDEARSHYEALLLKNPADSIKETSLLRLGLMALDDRKFEESSKYFAQLRTDFPKGSYRESSHWFEAWSRLMKNWKIKKGKQSLSEEDQESLKQALNLLETLPQLPEGEALGAQSIYWMAQIYELLDNKRAKEKTNYKLSHEWKASFHYLLQDENLFKTFRFNPLFIDGSIVRKPSKKHRIADPAFQQGAWQRLEFFANANLFSWAKLELESFLERTGSKNHGLKESIASRLVQLEDWSDLIRYAQHNFDFQIKGLNAQDPIAAYYYPQSYHQFVVAAGKEFEVSPFLAWGVMREESRFQADVISSAGAIGLLQIMPSLGDRLARKLKVKHFDASRLTDPETNVRLGVYHLRELIDQVQGWDLPPAFVFPVVVASYNAGTTPVKRWLKELGMDRLDIFVESIPYAETRAYVKRVLQSAQVYYLLYGEKIQKTAYENQKGKL